MLPHPLGNGGAGVQPERCSVVPALNPGPQQALTAPVEVGDRNEHVNPGYAHVSDERLRPCRRGDARTGGPERIGGALKGLGGPKQADSFEAAFLWALRLDTLRRGGLRRWPGGRLRFSRRIVTPAELWLCEHRLHPRNRWCVSCAGLL